MINVFVSFLFPFVVNDIFFLNKNYFFIVNNDLLFAPSTPSPE